MGWVACEKLPFILKNKKITQLVKTKVFDQFVLPAITYGVENWTTKQNIETIIVTKTAMERAMLNVLKKAK